MHAFRFSFFRKYFPIKLIKTTEISPEKNYIFACHPHGIMCLAAFGCLTNESCGFSRKFPGLNLHFVTLRFQFCMPFRREILMWLGIYLFRDFDLVELFNQMFQGGIDHTKTSVCHYLDAEKNRGEVAVIEVGGAREAFYCDHKNYKIAIKDRKGFVKIALRTG